MRAARTRTRRRRPHARNARARASRRALSLARALCAVFPKETTFALITPDAEEAGVRAEMVARLEGAGFVVLKQDLQTLPHAKARALAPGASEAQLALLGAAPSCLLALEKPFAVGELMALAGPSDPRLAKERAPASLRARYGADALRNAIEVATSADDAAARLAAAFGPRAFVGAPDERSVALLLPEATASGGAEAAALALKAAGFKVLAAKEVALSAEAAAELLAGADAGIVERATSGPVTAIAVSRPHAVCALGSLCGRAGALGLAAADGEGRSAIACAPSAAAAAAGVAALFPELLGLQTTLAIIKPDAVRAGAVDAIVARIEAAGFVVRARTSLALPAFKAEEFYAEHKGRPFLPNLVAFMSSGPCVALALSRVGAIAEWRALMGPTRTAAAREQQPGCLRALYGTDNTANATHGSDSPLSARRELKFWFPALSAQPLPAPSDVGGLVSQQLEPALVGALVELCKAKPDDPVRWLGAYLLTHNPNKPKVAQLVNPPARPAAKKAAPSHEVRERRGQRARLAAPRPAGSAAP